jgi:hypothetical protein
MKIHVYVFNRALDQEIVGIPPGPGHQFVFSLDLALKKYNHRKQPGQHVGTYSGFVIVLRETGPNDNFYKLPGYLVQYQSTYHFMDVGPVEEGEITEQGLLYFRKVGIYAVEIVGSKEFAITGGTGHYAKARGRVTAPGETGGDSTTRLLDIRL